MSIRFIDLFAGVGGFHHGLSKCNARTPEDIGAFGRVGFGVETESGFHIGQVLRQRFDCVYSNEWDKYANSVYKKHFGECDNRDIRTVNTEEIPDFDLLCGGFPCQSFSIAGKRGGFNDTRGTMFFEIARILKDKRPRYLLLENVKGLLTHDSGKTFATIIGVLADIGYDVQWQVLNSKNFGVPQNRERVFIIGNLRDIPRPKIFPLTSSNPKTLEYIGGILSEESKMWLDDGKVHSRNFPQGSRVYKDSGISATLASQAGGLGAKTGLYDVSRTIRTGGRGSIDEKHSWDIINDGVQIRRLTPIECERLQSFPDDWTKHGADGTLISDTQRYKMMGNAVTTNVVEAIGEKLCLN